MSGWKSVDMPVPGVKCNELRSPKRQIISVDSPESCLMFYAPVMYFLVKVEYTVYLPRWSSNTSSIPLKVYLLYDLGATSTTCDTV